ncbi:cap-specific mRNA (nucleoside-2'-O-)-methyltransferase 2-like isoform X2 [Amphiura filiformis]|uniref:cap-specific mRNA (nucleoside-2'-O-)-methyltransferase 2-like isoform X2 n=1 Tax=Amphiura filiformis TaxID=82378 RepID=UPI003B2211D8
MDRDGEEDVEQYLREDLQNMRELTGKQIESWKLLEGRRLTHIHSSPFCAASVLDDWNLACQQSQSFKQYTSAESTSRCDPNSPVSDLQPAMQVLEENLGSLRQLSGGAVVPCICLLSVAHDHFVQQLKTHSGCLAKVLRVQYNTDDTSAIEVVDHVSVDLMQSEQSWVLQAEHLTDYQAMLRLGSSLQSLKLPLMYVDCNEYDCPLPTQAELQARTKLFASLLLAVQSLRIGGVLVLHVPTLLTRFSVGVLYILHKIFTQVTLLGTPQGDGLKYEVNIYCQSYRGAYSALTQYLWEVYNVIASSPVGSTEREVLQLIPIAQLCESSFNQPIATFNCKVLSQQTKAIVRAELGNTSQMSGQL